MSCTALNSRLSKLLLQTCQAVFPEVASIFQHFMMAGVFLAIIEYATRRMWWATDLPPTPHRLHHPKQGTRGAGHWNNPALKSQGWPSGSSADFEEERRVIPLAPTTQVTQKHGDGLTEQLLP